jgi:hypothetical protein
MKRSATNARLQKCVGIGIALSMLIAPRVAHAVTVTLSPTQDSWIAQASPSANHGSDNVLRVRTAPTANQRSLLQFDLSGIPVCSTVTSAVLSLTVTNAPSATRTHALHKLTKAWTEAGVNWSTTDGSTSWTTAGGDFNGVASATANTGTTVGAVIQWTVTTDANTFAHTPSANLGWLLKDANEASGTDITSYGSKENGTTADRPELVVTYMPDNINCDDSNACTTDTCTVSGCQHTNNSGPCNDGLFCNGADTCNGSGGCTVHAGNPCPGPDGDTNCSESCNEAADNCTAADPNGTSCRPAAGVCDVAETCSGGVCPANAFATSGVCRAASGVCDKPESCNGSGANCPADAVQPATTSCRASGGVCDIQEFCDGSTKVCPPDAKSTAQCRASAGDCDVAENCNGVSNNCPVDGFASPSTVCRAATAGGVCDVTEFCTGSGPNCPPDSFQPASTVCRPEAAGEACDVAESCPGNGPSCPPDGFKSSSTVCRAASAGQDCDQTELCTGSGPSCPADAVKANGTVCRPSAGVCDVSDSCNGSSKLCPADAKSTAVCRAAVDVCDASESCDGSGNNCPADLKAANGTPCPDGMFCNGDETCQAGVCSAGSDPCPGSQICDEPSAMCTSCASAPANGCRTAGKSLIVIKDNANNSKDKLIWKFIKGQPTTFAELSDPRTTADYTLCIYAGAGDTLVGTIAVPASNSFWKVIGNNKGYKYFDPNSTEDGANKIKLKSSTGNKTKAIFKGRGEQLPEILGPTGLATPVTAQLVNRQTGVCLEGTYNGPPKKNTAQQFKAKQ